MRRLHTIKSKRVTVLILTGNVRGSRGVKGLDDHICITGGKILEGTVSIQGSKNAALPMMAASLLHRGVSVLKNCPRIADVFCMEEILMGLGAVTWWAGHDLYLDCTYADGTEIPFFYTSQMRSSVILLGAMLGRSGRGYLGYPGGCTIGERPIDLHLYVLKKLGARISQGENMLEAEAEVLCGNSVCFRKKSVGATEQGILAAVLAKGETVLVNCACEPEILHLCSYLKAMGALIQGEGTETISIRGVRELAGGCMEVPPDRIVAGTYICAAAITRGEVTILNALESELGAFLHVYRKIGGQYEGIGGKLIVNGKKIRNPFPLLCTRVYPGFPTDLQSPVMAVLTTVPGRSCIREHIFEDRFKIAGELNRMGARICIRGRDAVIQGGFPLHGANVRAKELRGGAALILAALFAEGETCLEGYSFVRRGYERICEDFCRLGADIRYLKQ